MTCNIAQFALFCRIITISSVFYTLMMSYTSITACVGIVSYDRVLCLPMYFSLRLLVQCCGCSPILAVQNSAKIQSKIQNVWTKNRCNLVWVLRSSFTAGLQWATEQSLLNSESAWISKLWKKNVSIVDFGTEPFSSSEALNYSGCYWAERYTNST